MVNRDRSELQCSVPEQNQALLDFYAAGKIYAHDQQEMIALYCNSCEISRRPFENSPEYPIGKQKIILHCSFPSDKTSRRSHQANTAT
jgi:hypothetical protein